MVIWYTFHVLVRLSQEKSGNPDFKLAKAYIAPNEGTVADTCMN
jgi:hypothetical protein